MSRVFFLVGILVFSVSSLAVVTGKDDQDRCRYLVRMERIVLYRNYEGLSFERNFKNEMMVEFSGSQGTVNYSAEVDWVRSNRSSVEPNYNVSDDQGLALLNQDGKLHFQVLVEEDDLINETVGDVKKTFYLDETFFYTYPQEEVVRKSHQEQGYRIDFQLVKKCKSEN